MDNLNFKWEWEEENDDDNKYYLSIYFDEDDYNGIKYNILELNNINDDLYSGYLYYTIYNPNTFKKENRKCPVTYPVNIINLKKDNLFIELSDNEILVYLSNKYPITKDFYLKKKNIKLAFLKINNNAQKILNDYNIKSSFNFSELNKGL